MAIDPICGMQVNDKVASRVKIQGKDYFFCSERCKEKFLKQRGLENECPGCGHARKPVFKNKLFIVAFISVLLLLASLFVPALVIFRKTFLLYLKVIWWAVFLGLLLGGVIDYYIPREYISKILARKSAVTIINAVLLGFLMSACSHGILALTIQLHKKGASNPAVVSFLLASPWANFTITVLLLSLFGLKGLLIILFAIIVAVNTGLIFMFLENKGLIEKNKNTVEIKEGISILKDLKIRIKNYKLSLKNLHSDLRGILSGSLSLCDMVLWWILLGMLIASFASTFIPVHFFHRFMGPTLLGLLVTLMLATVIEVCSEGSSPLAFEIYRQTGALGNSFVFLMAGVVTDYTEIGLLWANVGRRVALWLPLVTVPQVIAVGYLMNAFLK